MCVTIFLENLERVTSGWGVREFLYLADAAELSVGSIIAILDGSDPSLEEAYRIADALGLSLDRMCGERCEPDEISFARFAR
jgi:hypothetical protein